MGRDVVFLVESIFLERLNLIDLLFEGVDMGCSYLSFDGFEGRVGKYLVLRMLRFVLLFWEFDNIFVIG